MDVALLSERGFPGDVPARHGTGAGPVPGGGGGAPGVLGRAVASPRDDVTRAGHGARGPAPRRRVAGGGGRRRRATSGSGIAWWWSGRPVAAAVIIRWRPGRADPPVAPRGMSRRGGRRGPAPGGHLARAPGSTTSPPPPGARPRAAASAPGATGVARATRGGPRTRAGGIAGPRPAPGGRRLIIPAREGGALEDVGRHAFPQHAIPPLPGRRGPARRPPLAGPTAERPGGPFPRPRYNRHLS